MSKPIGIDLGTTNSCIAFYEGRESTVIPNAEGGRVTPSVVAFTKSGERLVGMIAKRQAITNPDRTISSIKRKMGSKYRVKIDDKKYSPQEISAMILQKMKADAEAYLGEKITEAVITVPAYFEDSQRKATRDSGKIAGMKVLRIINEPTAAALAYGLNKEQDQKILVFDLGGGTFDVSVLDIGDGVFEVKATSGNNHLGGDDYDEKVMEWIISEFKKEQGIDLSGDKMAMQRLKETAEKAKCELSTTQTANINLPFITADESGPKHLEMTLTRAKLVQLVSDLIDKCAGPTKRAMEDAGVKPGDLDHVLLVGGQTRMPAVRNLVKKLAGKEPRKDINPDEVVAVGAAIQAGVLKGEVKDVLLLDVTPLSLGIETKGGVFTRLIERNTTIPTKKGEIFSTAEDNQTTVEIHVLQGERPMAAFNKTLGKFQMIGLPPAPRGIPQIEVTFDIDANGIVHVFAKDLGTGNEQKITITSSAGISDNEIEKMVKDAEIHAEEDKKKREEAEIRNNADNLIYSTEKSMRQLGDKLPSGERSNIESAISELKKALAGTDVEAIKQKSQNLMDASHKLAEAVYAQTTQKATKAEESKGEKKSKPEEEEEVVDADYEVVDDSE